MSIFSGSSIFGQVVSCPDFFEAMDSCQALLLNSNKYSLKLIVTTRGFTDDSQSKDSMIIAYEDGNYLIDNTWFLRFYNRDEELLVDKESKAIYYLNRDSTSGVHQYINGFDRRIVESVEGCIVRKGVYTYELKLFPNSLVSFVKLDAVNHKLLEIDAPGELYQDEIDDSVERIFISYNDYEFGNHSLVQNGGMRDFFRISDLEHGISSVGAYKGYEIIDLTNSLNSGQ